MDNQRKRNELTRNISALQDLRDNNLSARRRKEVEKAIAKFRRQLQTLPPVIKLAMIFAIALIGQAAKAQTPLPTITNVGPGIAGRGILEATQRYNIGMTDDGGFVTINGMSYIVLPDSPAALYTHIVKWDDYKKKFLPYGMIKAKSLDGTQFMSGWISIKEAKAFPHMRVTIFKGVGIYTPPIMPSLTKQNDIAVYMRNNGSNLFILQPQLTIPSYTTSGAVWLNADYTYYAAVLDTCDYTKIVPACQVTIVPSDSGPGSSSNNPELPFALP